MQGDLFSGKYDGRISSRQLLTQASRVYIDVHYTCAMIARFASKCEYLMTTMMEKQSEHLHSPH